MNRAKYLPAPISEAVRATGAHYMCVLKKVVEQSVDLKTASASDLIKIAEDCVDEGKVVPVRKFLMRLGFSPS